MLFNILMLIAGLGVLVWSADRFVYGAAAFARNLGLPPMLIGLTIVAMGSSAPEMFVAATASMEGMSNTAVGNVLGSNVANITLILGITALLGAISVSSQTLKREIPLMLAATVLAGYLIHDGMLTRFEGGVLLVAFFGLMGYFIWQAMRNKQIDPLSDESDAEIPKNVPTLHAIIWIIVGMILLPLSADWMVTGAVGIAKTFGLSDLVIGLTIIAVGTSLPELAACIAGVLKKEDDLAIGNIVGSNLFNILAVLAIPGLIAPGEIDAQASSRDFYMVLGTSTALAVLVLSSGAKKQLTRWHGVILLVVFIAYQIVLFQSQ
ncbi:calcium/sodium antiporter [Shewanella sp. 1_MG-2023]|uniref:Calcium/sodium antiporter n=1 Tax=Shewanella electrodiphila TaxID=934143 RepID=A0ABT0KPH7_9GAMM|nr:MULTISPECIES: calcium/sodium antiporter [Shewanella]MCC4834058.1 calcium/sodium antiporter [Shewanella sp. 10N.7]MCL1045727.1 calcium/sodium antiporter [Shewanella electrodiphila]MDO6613496.1 calcium/sodium antiporter [Shewanella sp. 7_MG-2023]MDO6773326.1 calcium/sodium antiporter [Shewanella sp. 2_MG-2023]MDO6795977.1 calcium/sodium antiporter [Shewanella sp. 1_MG-2023]